MHCIQTASALQRIAKEAVEDAFACGVIYLEVRFAPQQLLEKGLTLDSAVKAVIDGLGEGTCRTGTIAKLIVICMRHHSPSLNNAVLECASCYFGSGVCAIDFVGDEFSYGNMNLEMHSSYRIFANLYELEVPNLITQVLLKK